MTRYKLDDLSAGAERMLVACGLAHAHARHLAQTVVAAEALGFHSHGLALLPRYLDEVTDGRMTREGEPEIVRDNGSNLTLDGRSLPGPAVVNATLDIMFERLETHGVMTAAIRRSAHIGCLSAYLERATTRGCVLLILSSAPHSRIVAPFGGTKGVYSPNPLACGIPTDGDPILIDTSMSSISFNRAREYHERGEELPQAYLFDNQGEPTKDPGALMSKPMGAIRPFGGADLGYKGFALGLIIEAFTSGLAGYGRTGGSTEASNAVFLLLIDPAAFGDGAFIKREMTALADACRAATTSPAENVRMPGERALARRREAMRDGVEINETVIATLAERARKLGVATAFARG